MFKIAMFHLAHNISIISNGLQLLVTNLESGCDAALVSMTKVTKATSIDCVVCYINSMLGCLATHRSSRGPE